MKQRTPSSYLHRSRLQLVGVATVVALSGWATVHLLPQSFIAHAQFDITLEPTEEAVPPVPPPEAASNLPLTMETDTDAELDLTVFPPVAYAGVKPGKTITHKVLLRYLGKGPVTITAELRDFKTDGLTGTPVLDQGNSTPFVTISNPGRELGKPFVLQPDTTTELTLKISPPADTLQQEYPLSLILIAEPTNTDQQAASGAQTAGGVASNIILWVGEDTTNKGAIELDQIQASRLIDSFGTLKALAIGRNTGSNALAVKGTVTLYHWSGKKLREWYVYPDIILANSTRGLRVMDSDPAALTPEDEIVFSDISYKKPFLLGAYTLTVQIESAEGDTQQLTTSIIALPFSLFAATLLGLGIILGIIVWNRRRQSKSWQ